jgi:hypothetical protein
MREAASLWHPNMVNNTPFGEIHLDQFRSVFKNDELDSGTMLEFLDVKPVALEVAC